MRALQLVQEVVEGWDGRTETLALPDVVHDLAGLGTLLERISIEDLPVIEHALGESLATGVGAEVSSEALKFKKRLVKGIIPLKVK